MSINIYGYYDIGTRPVNTHNIKKYTYPLPVYIYLQYSFPTYCEFYP